MNAVYTCFCHAMEIPLPSPLSWYLIGYSLVCSYIPRKSPGVNKNRTIFPSQRERRKVWYSAINCIQLKLCRRLNLKKQYNYKTAVTEKELGRDCYDSKIKHFLRSSIPVLDFGGFYHRDVNLPLSFPAPRNTKFESLQINKPPHCTQSDIS